MPGSKFELYESTTSSVVRATPVLRRGDGDPGIGNCQLSKQPPRLAGEECGPGALHPAGSVICGTHHDRAASSVPGFIRMTAVLRPGMMMVCLFLLRLIACAAWRWGTGSEDGGFTAATGKRWR